MSDYEQALGQMASRISGLRAVMVFESSGIEVSSWGGADPDMNSAEFAELLARVRETDSVALEGGVAGITIQGATGQWVLAPVGEDYVLALLADAAVPTGKLRFYAAQWVAEHGGEFD